jgi:hypothetical protein
MSKRLRAGVLAVALLLIFFRLGPVQIPPVYACVESNTNYSSSTDGSAEVSATAEYDECADLGYGSGTMTIYEAGSLASNVDLYGCGMYQGSGDWWDYIMGCETGNTYNDLCDSGDVSAGGYSCDFTDYPESGGVWAESNAWSGYCYDFSDCYTDTSSTLP